MSSDTMSVCPMGVWNGSVFMRLPTLFLPLYQGNHQSVPYLLNKWKQNKWMNIFTNAGVFYVISMFPKYFPVLILSMFLDIASWLPK